MKDSGYLTWDSVCADLIQAWESLNIQTANPEEKIRKRTRTRNIEDVNTIGPTPLLHLRATISAISVVLKAI